MKLLIITGSYPPLICGVGDYTHSLVKAIAAYGGIRVSILTSIGAPQHDVADEVQLFPVMRDWRMSELLKAVKILWISSSDIVHIQYPTQGYKGELLSWLLPLIAFLMRKKVVQTWHEIYTHSHSAKLLLKAIVPGGLVVVRPEYKKQFPPKLHWIFKNKKFLFIRNASSIPPIELTKKNQVEIKRKYIKQQKRLIVFFGFIYASKGVELLFDIANPELDQIVIVGQLENDNEYSQKILERADEFPWAGKVTFTGFLAPRDVASLLSVSDAVILPFRAGGGEWNTSIHTAVLQKAFVLTTSKSSSGFDKKNNVYYSRIDNIQEMKSALNTYAGKYRKKDSEIDTCEWINIAAEHYKLYEALLKK